MRATLHTLYLSDARNKMDESQGSTRLLFGICWVRDLDSATSAYRRRTDWHLSNTIQTTLWHKL